MMQFTETPPVHLHHRHQISTPTPPSYQLNPLSMNKLNQTHQRTRPWPGFPTSSKYLSSFGDANCMEQLLVHCANAIESNDATLAQQILWVLNNIAPPDGDSNQRLTSAFLRALIARAAKIGTCKLLAAMANAHPKLSINDTHKFSVIELASFVDLTPWHRFGFTAANAVILEAIEGFSAVHIVDLSLTHCMQIPTLIDAVANRFEIPPLIKLTIAGGSNEDYNYVPVPPMLDLSYEELGSKLVNFARSRNVMMEFRVIHSSYVDGFSSLIDQLRLQHLIRQESGEALVVNCHMMLRYIPEETVLMSSTAACNNNTGTGTDTRTGTSTTTTNTSSCTTTTTTTTNHHMLFECHLSATAHGLSSLRTMFLKSLRSLDPTIVVLVDEDADLTSNNLVCRLRSAFNYLWIPYDTMDTFLPRGSKQRQWYEADICWKIENVIACEDLQRVERLEPKSKWVQRMRAASFQGVSFGEDGVGEVKAMLDEHAAGWGLKREEDDHLLLTWKGHNVVFATAWIPTS